MSILTKSVAYILCDSCNDNQFGWEEEGAVFDSIEEALHYFNEGESQGWSTNGEGKHHCEYCPELELTDEGRAIIARSLTPTDIPLEGIPE